MVGFLLKRTWKVLVYPVPTNRYPGSVGLEGLNNEVMYSQTKPFIGRIKHLGMGVGGLKDGSPPVGSGAKASIAGLGNIPRSLWLPANYISLYSKKTEGTKLMAITSSNNKWYSKFFHWHRLDSKFAVKRLLKIPPHLKCVATLPWEIAVFKKPQLSKTAWSKLLCRTQNCHAWFIWVLKSYWSRDVSII